MKVRLLPVLIALWLVGTPAQSAQTITIRPDDETRAILREATADHWFKREWVLSTLVGGALAALGGFGAIGLADWLQAKRKRKDDAEFANNALRAIRRELEALSEVYDKGIGTLLKQLPTGKPFESSLIVTQDWFTVFNQNAAHLGRIDAEISRRIVTVYIRTKQVIEEFRTNNVYLEKIEALERERQIASPDSYFNHYHTWIDARLDFLRSALLFQADRLKNIDSILKQETKELFALLSERGIK